MREAVDLLAARAPTPEQAMTTARRKAYVILDGTVLPIGRIAADEPSYSELRGGPGKASQLCSDSFHRPGDAHLHADWKGVARTAVAQLRMEAAKYRDGLRLTFLVGELSVQDEDFRQWWAAHHAATLSVGTKVLNHPIACELSLGWDTLTASTDPDQQLVVWTAEVGSPAYDGLRILPSWAAGQYRTTAEPAE